MSAWLRLLRIGRLPGELRAQAESEGILHLAEFVPVTFRFSGNVPGVISAGSISRYAGAFVLTTHGVRATLSGVPALAGRAVDAPWTGETGAVRATVDGSGLAVVIGDLSHVDPRFSGTLSLRYREAVPAEVLASLPRREVAFDVPAEYVFRAVGVPVR